MEGIGSEVSQKIRSAIKAKLVELGAYSDDELPEYILVMVANKRSKSQMEEDLQLFLGPNTQKFTSWLHQVLQKLEEVKLGATGAKKTAKAGDGNVKEKPKQKDKEKEKSKDDRKRKSSTGDADNGKKDKRRKSEDARQAEHGRKDDKRSKSSEKDEKRSKSSEKDDKPSRNSEKDEHSSKTSEKDDEPSKKSEKDDKSSKNSEKDKKDDGDIAKEVTSGADESKQNTKNGEAGEVKKSSSVVSGSGSGSENNSDSKPAAKSGAKTSSAEIFKAEQKDTDKVQDDEEEDHDFINLKADVEADDLLEPEVTEEVPKEPVVKKAKVTPTVKVAAVVQEKPPPVPEKLEKPVVTPSPGRRFINLKEESNFYRSTASTKEDDRRITSRATRRRSPLPLSRKRPLSSRIGAIVTREEEDEQYDPANPAVGNVASVVRVKARPKLPIAAQANRNLLLKAMAEAQKSVANVQVRSDPTEVRSGLLSRRTRERLGLVPSEKIAVTRPHVRAPVVKEEENYDRILIEVEGLSKKEKEAMDHSCDRVSPDVSETEDRVPTVQEKSIKPRLGPKIEDSSPSEESSNRKLSSVRAIQESTPQSDLEGEPARSPQFVVTLDGIDPKSFGDNGDASKRRSSSEISVEEEESESALREDSGEDGDAFKQKRQRTKIVVTAEDDLKSKSERCKFWPVCRQGDKCVYHHPTVPCKAFPSCKFGEKCLYIHPNCKFDASCTRRDCPFTHASPRATAAFPVKSPQNVCRYFPSCSNVSCPFYHPKHCRFGKACNRSDCAFHHPELPSMEKLKWICPTKT